MATEEKYMNRCLQLARLGKNHASPNPMVGSVIVYKDKIIGEGYHQKYGNAHAEVNAINSVKNKELLNESTLYVNLEPCAHHGKTPPCSDLIIQSKIPKVVIGCIDSYSEVSGLGIKKMKKAGIDVKLGVLENESRFINRRFFTFHEKKRPFIVLKWAETVDGYIDIERNIDTPVGVNWITEPNLRIPVHKWRSEESAIIVGKNTAKNDNPSLTTRDWYGENPLRILIDHDFDFNNDLKICDGSTPTIVFTNKALESNNNIEFVKIDFRKDTLKQVLDILHSKGIQSLIVEGGRKLLQSFIDKSLWDEARVLVGDTTFGKGTKAPKLGRIKTASYQFLSDWIYLFLNKE